MPSPVGHSLAGLIIYQLAPEIGGLARRQVIALYVIAANAPDLDFVPGLIVGAPNRFHHGATHSIGAALVFATLLTLLLRLLGKEGGARPFLVFLGLYVSHLLLDYFGTDTSPPFGIPALWPASAATYMAPVTPFGDIHRTNSTADFFPSLFSAHNLWAVSLECLFLVPLLLLAFAWRKRRSAASGCSRTLAP